MSDTPSTEILAAMRRRARELRAQGKMIEAWKKEKQAELYRHAAGIKKVR